MKYSITYTDKEVVSVRPADTVDPTPDTILEDRVGQTIFATVEAADDAEAHEKARRIQQELQTRRTKRDLGGQ